MRLAAHQPQYLPWLGYFAKMDRVDLFVLLDVVQFKKNEWQNRNRIRIPEGWQWLTVPVRHRFPMSIREVAIDETSAWRRKHREALRVHYGRSPHRGAILEPLDLLLQGPAGGLADLNTRTVKVLAGLLGVSTPIVLASSLGPLPDDPDGRLIHLCRHFGCDTYLAGPGGTAYMDPGVWRRAGVRVDVQEFRHPVYTQAYPGFEPNLSAVDLLLAAGPGAIVTVRAAQEARV
ncbi:MAG: WbqC family protein [Candidatus Polarisedimenticolia bacterium]